MLYRGGWSALQVPNERGDCDWHSNIIDSYYYDTDKSLFGDWGIFEHKGVPTANHSRALLDLLENGMAYDLHGIRPILGLTKEEELEVLGMIYDEYGIVLDFWLSKEFPDTWVNVRHSKGDDVPTPFLDFLKRKGYDIEPG